METKTIKRLIEPNAKVITLVQFTFPLALYFALCASMSIYYWLVSASMVVLYVMVGNNIAMHRYYSHNEFKVTAWAEVVFAWLSLTLCLGSPTSYALLHTTHHRYPLSGPDWTWKDLPFYKHIWFDNNTIQPKISKYIIQLNKRYSWMHRYYMGLIALYVIVLTCISPIIALFIWWLPVTVSLWIIALCVYCQHRQTAQNSKWHKFMPLYEGLHKNHHDYPGSSNNARTAAQIDYTYLLSKVFRK